MVQQNNRGVLHYELISENGPDHNKVFVVEAMIDKEKIGSGAGKTKKAAEQQAAYEALQHINRTER